MQVIEKVGLLAVAVPAEFTNCLLSVVPLDVLFQVPAIKEYLDIMKAFKKCVNFLIRRAAMVLYFAKSYKKS